MTTNRLGEHIQFRTRTNAKFAPIRCAHFNARRHNVQHVDDNVDRRGHAVTVRRRHRHGAQARAVRNKRSRERRRSAIGHIEIGDFTIT